MGTDRHGGLAVCIFCASSTSIDTRYVELATATGAELARRGHSLVSGGGSVSCMGAIARAARCGGAHTIGVIPQALVNMEVADADADELCVTADMRTRKAEMDRRADAFLTLPGGLGTLEELLEVWTARILGMHDKPIVVLDPFGFYTPLRGLAAHLLEQRFARPAALDAVAWADNVASAFDLLERAAGRIAPTQEEILEAEP